MSKYFFLAFIFLLLSSCHRGIGDRTIDEGACGTRHVRIAATIDPYALPGGSTLRTVGELTDDVRRGSDDPGESYERAVYFAVLYIYPEEGEQPSEAWIYFTNAFAAAGERLVGQDPDRMGQSNPRIRHFASTGEDGTLTMDLELAPGSYRMVLVANSLPALRSALGEEPTDPRSLVTTGASSFTSLDLMPDKETKLPSVYLPMVGVQEMTISRSLEVPQEVKPAIPLERTHARLDLYLTTADREKGDFLREEGYTPEKYKFAGLTLTGLSGGYDHPLFPVEGETSQITERTTEKVKSATATVDTSLSEVDHFNEGGRIKKLWREPLLRKGQEAVHLYIPSLRQEKYKGSMALRFARKDHGTDERTYTLHLTNEAGEDLYAIRRNTSYRYELEFYGEKIRVLGPFTVTAEAWTLHESYQELPDEHLILSREHVTLTSEREAAGQLLILRDDLSKEVKKLSYSFEGGEQPEWLAFDKQPSELTGQSAEISFHATTPNDDDREQVRSCTLIVTPEGYARPLKVVIRQVPEHRLMVRPYVAFVGDEASGPLEAVLPVRSHGFVWTAEVVDSYCTSAAASGWIRVEKIEKGAKLKITVTPVERMNILRFATIKLYDGTNNPAYVRVEQGGYKGVSIAGQTWLDRNMGALSYATPSQWREGEMTGYDRVRVNGCYYQWGRVPDGYQYNGLNVLAGNINPSLTPDEICGRGAYRQPKRLGDRSGTKSSKQGMTDPQYQKYITARDGWVAEGFRPSRWEVDRKRPHHWTSDVKQSGIDPCPEGYRVPTKEEFLSLLADRQSEARYDANAFGYFIGALYIPLGGWRDGSGALRDWHRRGSQPPYARYALSGGGPGYFKFEGNMIQDKEGNYSDGYLVRCIKIKKK